MTQSIRHIVVFAAMAALTACGSRTLTSEVTRFHELPPIQGQTVAIVAKDAGKAGSIEFGAYADQVAQELSRHGFRPAGEAPPELIAQIDYSQRPVGTDERDSGSRVGIGIGGGSGGRSHVGIGLGTSFAVGSGKRRAAQRTFIVEIDDRQTGKRVFEGRAQSVGAAENFASALPYMISALFDGFPGNSGETVTVKRTVE